MACSSTPLAAVIVRDILKAGGNAADAALAMAAVVNVTELAPRCFGFTAGGLEILLASAIA